MECYEYNDQNGLSQPSVVHQGGTRKTVLSVTRVEHADSWQSRVKRGND